MSVAQRNERLAFLQQADRARSQAKYQPLIIEDDGGRMRYLDVFMRKRTRLA